jgi:AcrR family transcriptional regulator
MFVKGAVQVAKARECVCHMLRKTARGDKMPSAFEGENHLGRTEVVIIRAFTKLMRTTPFEKITVKDIVELAMINRSTFYLHFKDKYEIAERMQESFIETMWRALKVIRPALQLSVSKGNKLFAKFFGEHREAILTLLKINASTFDAHGEVILINFIYNRLFSSVLSVLFLPPPWLINMILP